MALPHGVVPLPRRVLARLLGRGLKKNGIKYNVGVRRE
jgi:hypothetical protein